MRMSNEKAAGIIKEHCYFNGLVPVAKEALDYAVQLLEQTSWVPVSERLPELDVNVHTKKNPLMVSKPVYISYKLDGRDYVCPIPCILHSNGYWYIDNDSLEDWVNLDDYDSGTDSPLSNLEVTAWMPQPKPYKPESEV